MRLKIVWSLPLRESVCNWQQAQANTSVNLTAKLLNNQEQALVMMSVYVKNHVAHPILLDNDKYQLMTTIKDVI